MPVIPSSIASTSYATYGEKKLHSIFSKLYGDSEDEFVWYEPPSLNINGTRDNRQKRFTDFIFFSQSIGILNLEVKDWKREKIKKINNQYWEIEIENGNNVRKESPLEQSRKCAYAIKNRLLSIDDLKHKAGGFANKLLFPFAYGIVFSNLTKKDLEELNVLPSLIDERQILTKDDLQFEISERQDRLDFEKKLKNMFTTWFEFETLNYNQIKKLRAAIWPELIVTPVRTYTTNTQTDDLKLLDLEQENFAKSLGDGHYLIRGVAGSGKTLVLTYRARYLSDLHPNWRILFVCYNKSLKNYVKKMMNNLMQRDYSNNITVTHFYELVGFKTGQSVQRLANEDSSDWDLRVGLMLRLAGQSNRIVGGKYDAILLDETQDFSTEWLNGVRFLLNENDSLTIALDPAQDVYRRRRVWRDAGIDVMGRRSRKLKQSYRNTSEILRLAIRFKGFDNYIENEEEDNPDNIIVPDEIEHHGEKASILRFSNYSEVLNNICEDIRNSVNSNNYCYKDIAIIICSNNTVGFDPNSTLQNIPSRSLLLSNQRDDFDIDEDTIKIITVESSKGLEWKIIYLIGIDGMPRENRDNFSENNLLYIGITRAQEKLKIYYCNENEMIRQLKEINNGL
jgi:hypothetical protein